MDVLLLLAQLLNHHFVFEYLILMLLLLYILLFVLLLKPLDFFPELVCTLLLRFQVAIQLVVCLLQIHHLDFIVAPLVLQPVV